MCPVITDFKYATDLDLNNHIIDCGKILKVLQQPKDNLGTYIHECKCVTSKLSSEDQCAPYS